MSGRDKSRPWYIKMARYASVVLISLIIGYISSRPVFTAYWDTTAQQFNTIHPHTQQVIKDLKDSTLEVTLYTNLLAKYATIGLPSERNQYISYLWEQYQRFKLNIEFKYEYYYAVPKDDMRSLFKKFPGKSLKQIVGLMARINNVDSSLFKSPEEINKIADVESEGNSLVMQLKYRGAQGFLRTSFDISPLPDQMAVSAAFRRVMKEPTPKSVFHNRTT